MSPDKQTLPLAYNDNGKNKMARAFAEGVLFSTYVTTNILRNVDFTNPVLGFGYVNVKSYINENRKKQ